MNVLLLAIGTRGDIQPFIALGLRLREAGYRVRLASHAAFRAFVADSGLEFYPLGGDPVTLARCAAQTGGIFPPRNFKAVDELRRQIGLYLEHQLDACSQPDPDTPGAPPFKAEAIIANPISYGHVHLADHLGLPLHFLWTQPETATRAFAHPQARFLYEKMWQVSPRSGSVRGRLLGRINHMSYAGIHCAMAMGVGDLLSKFRREQLQAPPLWQLQHYHRLFDPPMDQRSSERRQSSALPIPSSYVYSPSLVPRPQDWPDHVQVVGYCHAPAQSYQPPPQLQQFLETGPPPVYFGFGSMPVNQPERVLLHICGAVGRTGQRALLLADDWGEHAKLIAKQHEGQVLLISAVPHSWLFPRCAAVVHHGGAGTTGAGLAAGKPTAVLPAFADQAFWPIFVNRAGAGPRPVAIERVTERRLFDMLSFMARPEVVQAAKALGARIAAEPDGALLVVQHFERHLALWRQAQPQPPSAQQPRQSPDKPAAHRVQPQGNSSGGSAESSAQGSALAAPSHAPSHAHGDGGSAGAAAATPAAAASPASTPVSSGRSLGGRRVTDSCSSAGQPAVISVRASSSLMDDMETGWTSSRSMQVHQLQPQEAASSSAVPASARYFRLKRAPRLTAWVEGSKALGQTLLLPLISMAPCNGIMLKGE
jgi:sterol 3beta-glucosyltransferase